MKRKRVQLICTDPSLAIQSQKEESDINNIVRSFGVTGKLPSSVRLPQFGDFEGVDDYRSALEAVKEAQASFLAIPSNIRERFNHDPQAFADFCLDKNNLSQLQEWGLAPKPQVVTPPQGG